MNNGLIKLLFTCGRKQKINSGGLYVIIFLDGQDDYENGLTIIYNILLKVLTL